MLLFLKLGGSLITDKRQAETPRLDVLTRLAAEIAQARRQNPALKLVIGNGAGSFGHVPAKRYGTRDGVRTAEEWFGFAQTADAAARLCRLVSAALLDAGVPVWSIQPSAALRCEDGHIVDGPAFAIAQALQNGLVPVVHGDVALDSVRGGTISSTEEIFDWLANALPLQLSAEHAAGTATEWRLSRLVLAGEVDGIYTADPQLEPGAKRIPTLTSASLKSVRADRGISLGVSHGIDVTGGMSAKVDQCFGMIERHQGLEIVICSGLIEGNVLHALQDADAEIGTRLLDEN